MEFTKRTYKRALMFHSNKWYSMADHWLDGHIHLKHKLDKIQNTIYLIQRRKYLEGK